MHNRLTKISKQCCAFCNKASLLEIVNFGKVALAGGFLHSDNFNDELFYPLRLFFCNNCFSVQVIDYVSSEVLFKNYFYYSSSIQTLNEHFNSYAVEVTERFLFPEDAIIVEIGCNDGVLLKPLADQKIKTVIGVDPATNVTDTINDSRIHIINNFFKEEIAQHIILNFGFADLVLANNVYAHITDIKGVTQAIKNVLNDDGVFIFEVHYLGKVIDELQFDMIYHEHLYYYSLISLSAHFLKYKMVVFDVKSVPIHGGSMRFYVCNMSSKYSLKISPNVKMLRDEELSKGYNLATTYKNFGDEVFKLKYELIDLLTNLKKEGYSIAGYGASGRANTLIQYCKISHEHLDYIIDDSPAKVGYYTPGVHFKICSNEILNKHNRPDYVLIFAWSFLKEIGNKNIDYLKRGGKFIIPLPKVEILTYQTYMERSFYNI